MSEPTAKIICDSFNSTGNRLTTIEVKFHRFILAEMNTHRVMSRNSASSRAIPVKKTLERVRNDPAIPIEFPAEQKGMQGGELLDGAKKEMAIARWLEARDNACRSAEHLTLAGVHKSVVNRLLEPFSWHTAIISGTDWDGFWEQRCSPLAQTEMRVAAEKMRDVYLNHEPSYLDIGEWHLPYIQLGEEKMYSVDKLKMLSTARCARVSYLTHDGIPDIDKDFVLYNRLVTSKPGHWSPLEHVATPKSPLNLHIHYGNFSGWSQHRHEIELGEIYG